MGSPSQSASSNNLVTLSKPYHYRRNGVYYLRMRPEGALKGYAVSLRSTDKAVAMSTSIEIQNSLNNFHLNDPDATWQDLREYLRVEAERLLSTATPVGHLEFYWHLLDGHIRTLSVIAATLPMTVDQVKTIMASIELFKAAQRRAQGDPTELMKWVEFLNHQGGSKAEAWGVDVLQPAIPSLSVRPPNDHSLSNGQLLLADHLAPQAMTFKDLADAYMLEHTPNIKPRTLTTVASALKILTDAFETCAVVNMATHTRAELMLIKASLSESRQVSSVNALLGTISTVFGWAMRNGLIKHNYALRIKTLKGAKSSRKGLTVDQVDGILIQAAKHVDEAIPLAFALAAITGARVQEILQLRKEDIAHTDVSAMTIHINEAAEGKSVKNAGSIRVVPLVASSRWFTNAETFKAYVEALPTATSRLFPKPSTQKDLGLVLRESVGPDKDLVFHSLRHTMSGLLQSNEVSLQTAAAILGHTTGSITFDTYGTTMGQKTLRDALEKVLPKPVTA